MARTYRHRPFDFLPVVEYTYMDWKGNERIITEPANGWHDAVKHFNAYSGRRYNCRQRNRRVRRDKSYYDWDNYVQPIDKT